MIAALLLLVAFELVGEVVREAFSLAVPGPVIGMFMLAAVLVFRKGTAEAGPISAPVSDTAEALIGHMGLLFVPAGVGIITEAGVLEREWLPILAGLVGSTILSLAVTGLVMHWSTRPKKAPKSSHEPAAGPTELAQPHGRAS